jgi:hypothetical protein
MLNLVFSLSLLLNAEYPAVSVSHKRSPEHRWRHRPKINAITASCAGSQSEALFTGMF